MRNPLSGLPHSIRDSCVLAVVPATGSVRDWSVVGASDAVVGSPYWRKRGTILGLQCTGTGYVTIADNAAQRTDAVTLFVALSEPLEATTFEQRLAWKRSGTGMYDFKFSSSMVIYIGGTNHSSGSGVGVGSKTVGVSFKSGTAGVSFYTDGALAYTRLAIPAPNTSDTSSVNVASGYNASVGVPIIASTQFNRVLTAQEMGLLHTWSQSLTSPSRTWPGYGTGLISRPSRIPYGLQTVPPSVAEGAEELTDGDMEAVGTAAWTAHNGAVPTKVAGARTGGGGTQVLQVTGDGATAYGGVYQSVSTGKKILVRGWARGDGTNIPIIFLDTYIWTATQATDWEYFDVAGLDPTAARAYLRCTNASGYTQWDDVSAVETNELISDGEMESAGTSAWTVGKTADLSKQTTNPYSGLQVLRVARNGTTNANAQQSILSAGVKYRTVGRVRSDGSAVPRVVESDALLSLAVILWEGTTSTDWQTFDVTFVASATSTVAALVNTAAVDGQYVEFDSVSVVRVDECIGSWDLGELRNGVVVDRSGNGNNGAVVGNFQKVNSVIGMAGWFPGNAYVDIGNTGQTVQSVEFIFRPNGNEKIMDFDGGTHVIEVVAGVLTATGFSSPTIYVNGQTTSAVTVDDVWQHVVVTTATGFTVSDLDIGRESSNYFSGSVQSVQMYSDEKSAAYVVENYDRFARLQTFASGEDTWRVSLAEEGGAAGQRISNTEFLCADASGRWKVIDDVVNGESTRVLECQTAGAAYIPINGVEFETVECWMRSPLGLNNYFYTTVEPGPADNGYGFMITTLGALSLRRYIGGGGATLIAASTTVSADQWVGLRWTRNLVSEWELFTNAGDGWVSEGTATLDHAAFYSQKCLTLNVTPDAAISRVRRYLGPVAP